MKYFPLELRRGPDIMMVIVLTKYSSLVLLLTFISPGIGYSLHSKPAPVIWR